MKALQYALLLILFPTLLAAQAKKMTPEVYEEWHSIDNEQISNKGNWVSYLITNEAGKSELNLYNTRTGKDYKFDRAQKATFDIDEKFIAFHITAHPDTIKEMKRRKMKKSKMPKDTLCIFNLASKNIERIPNVDGYRCSNDFGFILLYILYDQYCSIILPFIFDQGAVLFHCLLSQLESNVTRKVITASVAIDIRLSLIHI